ncbi:MAG TPA: sulfotransferase, partial [Sphingomonadales bacterium]|nr:sulfotransferase [Sphingomonadales bacterium]
ALERYGEAFQSFVEGNRLLRAAIDTTAPPAKEILPDVKAHLGENYQGVIQTSSSQGEAPVFLLGFQQSGHQILTALLRGVKEAALVEHSSIFSALRLRLSAQGFVPSGALQALAGKELDELRAHYHGALKTLGAESGKILIQANPANFYELPLILRMFPRSRIIFAGAHPLDTCLHCFVKDFVPGRAARIYSDLNDAAAFMADSVRLWEKFKAEMSFAFLEVRVENLFEDTEAVFDRVLDFIREESPYPFTVGARGIDRLHEIVLDQKTLSPPGRWKHYREYLTGIAGTLREACRQGGYESP